MAALIVSNMHSEDTSSFYLAAIDIFKRTVWYQMKENKRWLSPRK